MSEADSYEPISRSALMSELNGRLIEFARLPRPSRVVDAGCGTGSLTRLLLDRYGNDVRVWAFDPNPEIVASARKNVGARAGVAQARAEDFGALFPPESVDAVLLGNCIHLVEDIPAAFGQTYRVLRGGGRVAFNSTFFPGSEKASERGLYWRLLVEARREARALQPGAGSGPARGRPLAKRSLTQAFYRGALEAAGFGSVRELIVEVRLPMEFVLQVMSAPIFAAGTLPGVEPHVAARALERAARRFYQSSAPDLHVTRKWLNMSATKGSPA